MTNQIVHIPTVYGEPVDDVPFPKSIPRARVDVNHSHTHTVKVDNTHALLGQAIENRRAQKQRRNDALFAAKAMFIAIRDALNSKPKIEKDKQAEQAGQAGGTEAISGIGQGGSSATNHSCTTNGDWGDYGYF